MNIHGQEVDLSEAVKGFDALYAEYGAFVTKAKECTLDLGKFLPALGEKLRPIVPGELVVIGASTGTGKTAILQNIAHNEKDVNILMFSLELPGPMIFERQVSISHGLSGEEVERSMLKVEEGCPDPEDVADYRRMKNFYACSLSRLSTGDIEQIITEAKHDPEIDPSIVMVDYIGLLDGMGKRYERMSDAAEDLKRVAKNTDTVMVIASQLRRKEGEENEEVYLHDFKDSGSIENSAQLALGAWRKDKKTLCIKILKATRAKRAGQITGTIVTCDFDGPTLQINERISFDEGFEDLSTY